MKNFNTYKKLLWIVTYTIISSSCESPSVLNEIEDQQVLKFHNKESLLDYISDESKNSQVGRVANTEKFVSFHDTYIMAIQELNQVSDFNEQNYLLNKYKDVVELRDSTIKPIISLGAYSKICNKYRVYQTGDYINKVITDDYLITTHNSNYQRLVSINSIEDIDNDVFKVIKLTTTQNITNRTNANCGKEILVDYFKNSSGCKNDRRVWIYARAYFVYYGDDMYLPYSEIKVYGEKRNWLCSWSPYETELNYRNVSFSVLSFALDNPNWGWTTPVNALRTPFIVSVPDYYGISNIFSKDVFKGPTGAWLNIDNDLQNTIIGQIYPPYEFSSIRIEASSRGTDNNWAVINCQ